ncbi:MAG: hypothetical protein RLZZ227_222 [Pseudomonadota bacterium]|jgi:putative copper resistance protein D
MNYWSLASSASKWLGLLAMAGVTGGSFSLWLAARLRLAHDGKIPRYMLASAVLGLCAACGFFLVQIGAINQAGLVGMFDGTLVRILAQTPLGYAAALRVFAFACIAAAAVWMHGLTRAVVLVASIVLLAFTVSLTGHISTLAYIARVGVVLHVLTAFLWVGALYPLLLLSAVGQSAGLKQLMLLFGQLAVYGVAVLLVSGMLLLAQTLASLDALLTTAYGQAFLVKLGGVVLLLGLAATNKLLLVPRLTTLSSTRRLRLSIRAEILIACFVLAVTAWLTTAVGPAH